MEDADVYEENLEEMPEEEHFREECKAS